MIAIRKASAEDLDILMDIFDEARQFMRDNKNTVQWVNGYPQRELIASDIADGCCYVCEEGSRIVGVFAYRQGEDPTYLRIENGEWRNSEPYGTIHRLASRTDSHGIAKAAFSFCAAQNPNLRGDTHEANLPMQHVMESFGFLRCGTIYTSEESPRIAYHYIRPDNI